MFELKREESCFMPLDIDAKFEGNLTRDLKNGMWNLVSFYRLENSDFNLESKMAELNQNKNSKQLDQPDAQRKLYFILEINEKHN